MNAEMLNAIMGTFIGALDGAFGRLFQYSVPLLSVLGLIYLLLTVGQMMLHSHSLAALGDFLWVVLKIGVIYFFVIGFYSHFLERRLLQLPAVGTGGRWRRVRV